MKIWIDARKISNFSDKSNFIKFLINFLNKKDTKNNYIIYSNSLFKADNLNKNFEIKKVKSDFSGLWQIKFWNLLKADKLDLVLFFDYDKPLFYNKKYLAFPWWLEDLFFPWDNFKSTFSKTKYNLLTQIYLDRAEKVFVFNNEMKQDLNDKLNLKEDKIIVFNPPLFKYANKSLDINTKLKHWIANDYFLTNWDWATNNNLERIIKVIWEINNSKSKQNIDLIISWNKASSNIELRDFVVRNNLQNCIHFVWDINPNEEESYYKKSIWYIYSSIYDLYPFSLSKAINYNTFILASDNDVVKNIFWNRINYFNSLSDLEMKNILLKQIKTPKQADYKWIYEDNYKKFEEDIVRLIKNF